MNTTFSEFNTELDSLLNNLNDTVKSSLNDNEEIDRSNITRMSNEEMIKYIEKYEPMIFGNISYIKKDKIYNKKGLEEYFYFLKNQYSSLFERAEKTGFKSVVQNAFKYDGKPVYNMLDFIENEVDCLSEQYNGLTKGLKGEKNLSYFVNSFSDQVEYIENLRINCDGQNAESDGIIIAPNGIFTIEVKNYSCDIVIEENGRFFKKGKNGQLIPQDKSVVEQAKYHANLDRKFLKLKV